MTQEERLPWNPEGTVGVAVADGSYGSESSVAIRKTAQTYLARAGLEVAPMPFKQMGGAGEIIMALATGLAGDIFVHIWKRTLSFFRSWSDRKMERRLRAHRVACTIQLGDKRGEARDAVQLLQLLPGLNDHLAAEYPNRNIGFIIFSATPSISFVQVLLNDYDDLTRTVRQMTKILFRIRDSEFINLTLQDGPFGSRRVTFNAV